MGKYCFRVYVEGSGSVEIVPSSINGIGVAELHELDNFVFKSGGYLNLCSLLANELNIGAEKIENIRILQVKKGIEFSITAKNPYLEPVLDTVRSKEISDYRNYKMTTMTVDSNSDSYKAMVDYLFKNLENDSYNFFANVYRYDNEFKQLLVRYVSSYQFGMSSEEEVKNLLGLKDKILKGLSIYKNYRGLCKARYEYENRYGYVNPVRHNNQRIGTVIKPKEAVYDPNRFQQEPMYQVNQYVNDLGDEREEFLDESELFDEECYGKRR